MTRRSSLLLLSCLLLATTADARREKFDDLVRVVTPVNKGTAPAHPHVNLIVLFGSTIDGVAADPATFKAKLNGQDVTDRFTAVGASEFGGEPGLRAAIEPSALRVGGGNNKLTLSVRSLPFPRGKRTKTGRDKDRLRFVAEEAENQAPVVSATSDTDIIFPGLPVQFDGSASTDPELDALTFAWDFGDGDTGSEPAMAHTFGEVAGETTVTLAVSDGGTTSQTTLALQGEPALDPDRTKGVLQVSSSAALEFGGVPVGQTGERVLTVANLDATVTSQLKVSAQVRGDGFTLDPTDLDLGPSETGEITVTFAPTAGGHADAKIALVASASNRSAVSTIAHGFGGAAPAGSTGPSLAARTAFYSQLDLTLRGLAVHGLRPDGTRFFADNGVNTCVVPGGGSGTGDACITDADCAANGGTCARSAVCSGGPNAGQACTTHADCPQSLCPSYMLLDPEDICADASGNYFVLSEEGSFTDPNFNAETEQAATLLRVTLDGDVPVQKQVLDRPTEETTNMACDSIAPAAGGRVFLAEYFNVDVGACFRTEREAFTSLRKSNGTRQVLLARLDSVQGIDECNDIEDASAGLASSRDGAIVYASFDVGGAWRVRPSPLAFLTSLPDAELLDVHPDGALIYANATDSGTEGRINLHKISAGRVSTGPLPLAGLTPCGVLTVPNNGGRTFVQGLAVEGSADHPTDGLILVSFLTSSGGVSGVLGTELRVRGVAAFRAPSGPDDTCTLEGLITLDPVEQLSF
jgi:PKD repeat protein